MSLTRDLPLLPEQAALLFIDVQNFSAHRDGGEFKDESAASFNEKFGWFFDELESVSYTHLTLPTILRV